MSALICPCGKPAAMWPNGKPWCGNCDKGPASPAPEPRCSCPPIFTANTTHLPGCPQFSPAPEPPSAHEHLREMARSGWGARLFAAEVTALLAEHDALAADATRLDWIESVVRDPRCVSLQGNPPQGLRHTFSWTVHRNGIGHSPWKETAREAIDAAMQRAERGTEPTP